MKLSRRAFAVGLAALPLGAQTAPRSGKKDLGVEPETPPKPAGQPGASGRRKALVIGNNAYSKAHELKNAVHDAGDVGEVLKRSGFEVASLMDANEARLKDTIARFTAGIGGGDVALLFYSGHGVQIGGENYLIPVDIDPKLGESRVKAACQAASHPQQSIEKAGARLNIVVLDACRNNPFGSGLTSPRGLALMEGGLGTYIALATGPGQVADDNPAERNGLFSKHLLREFVVPGQSLDAVFKKVKEQVYAASGGQQRPWLHADMIGDFYPQAAGAPAPPPPADLSILDQAKKQFQNGQFEEAAQSFERARRGHPDDPFPYNALGVTFTRMGRWSQAVDMFSRAIELKPDYAAAYYNRGIAYQNAGRYELAVQDFSWAVDQEPFDPLLVDMRGRAYFSLLDYDHALEDFNRALELNPTDSAALLGRGRVFFRRGRYAEALRDLTDSLGLRPVPESYEMRAQTYRAMGRTKDSEADQREAARLRGQ
jgi:tetratricopeptide (TPR) repeat protein